MPPKRPEALDPLTRDHRLALLLARGIQSGAAPQLRASLPKGARTLAVYVCRVFDEEIEGHFAAEETVVLRAVEGLDPALDVLCKELEAEHEEMRALVRSLRDAKVDVTATEQILDRFGRLLESHVRKEEQSFYQRVQEVLDPATLEGLGAKLQRHLKPAAPETAS
jgi:hemerythrin